MMTKEDLENLKLFGHREKPWISKQMAEHGLRDIVTAQILLRFMNDSGEPW